MWSESDIEKFKAVRPVLGVDFDGTCVLHDYPRIGEELAGASACLTKYSGWGAPLVLFTMRSGPELHWAVMWFRERGIPLWGINVNPQQHTWTTSPKAECHYYIDDAGCGAPLLLHPSGKYRPHIDWERVDDFLRSWILSR